MANKRVRWVFNLSKWNPSESDMLLATACIQPEEKVRLARFVFKKDLKSSLIGRLMMRQFVHQTTSTPYNEIKFERDFKGKPILIYPNLTTNLAFNASHHGNYTVLAGEIGCSQIGADVMTLKYSYRKSLKEYFRLMHRTFSQSEWVEIENSGNDETQFSMFCRHWALKESYVKAIGVGITVNLQDICFKINTKNLVTGAMVTDTEIFVNKQKLNWTFEEALIDEDHCVAVATNNDEITSGNKDVVFREIDFCEVVRNAVPLLEFDKEYCTDYFNKE